MDEIPVQQKTSENVVALLNKLKTVWQARGSIMKRYRDLICLEESLMSRLNNEVLALKQDASNDLIGAVYQLFGNTQSLLLEAATVSKAFNQLRQLMKRYESLNDDQQQCDTNPKDGCTKSDVTCSVDVSALTVETVRHSDNVEQKSNTLEEPYIHGNKFLANENTDYTEIINCRGEIGSGSGSASFSCLQDRYCTTLHTTTTVTEQEEEGESDGEVSLARQQEDGNPHVTIEKSVLLSHFRGSSGKVMRKILTTKYQCMRCGDLFTSQEFLRRHECQTREGSVSDKPTSAKKSQNRCDKSLQSPKSYICKVCMKRFRTSGLLRRHTDIHTDRKRYQCSECDEVFMYSMQRTKHMSIAHSLTPPTYSCSFCTYSCFEYTNMSDHIRTHTNEKTQLCSVCGSSFSSRSAYRLHMRTHSDVRPYKCKECGKEFRTSYHRSNHERSHKKTERSFRCETCGKTYLYSRGLQRHLSQSVGHVSQYICIYCKTNCISESHLQRHLKLCGKGVTQ